MLKILKLLTSVAPILSTFLLQGLFAGVVGSLQQTATTLQPGRYEARGQADLIMNRGGGFNVSGHFAAGLIEDTFDLEGFVGTGKTNFEIGALGKFNFLPDIPGQIGLAFFGGYTYILDDYEDANEKDSINVLSFATIASSRMEVSFGSITPYGGLQVEGVFKSGGNIIPVTAILGAEWNFQDISPWVFFSELEFPINKSVFLIGLGGAYRF